MNINEAKNYGDILAKVWSDKNYLQDLINKPEEVLVQEGFAIDNNRRLSIKKGTKLSVNTKGQLTEITLPPSPEAEEDVVYELGQLIDSDMHCVICSQPNTSKQTV